MLIAGMLCLCAAITATATGIRGLSRPPTRDHADQVRRAVAPTQLAAALMLAAGGAAALGAGRSGLLVLVVCVVGAVTTAAAGSWQGARFALAQAPQPDDCAGSCASCALSCH